MRIFDIFTFFNELDMLEMRLEMMDPYVDRFVIIECVETFSGNPKPLHLKDQLDTRFKKYKHKISYMMNLEPLQSYDDARKRVLDDTLPKTIRQACLQALTSSNVPPGELHWLKEFFQKELLRLALESSGIEDDDLCFIGDLDEFWNPELDYKNFVEDFKIYKLKQLVYSLYLNNRSNEDWAGTLLTKYKNVKNACLNHLRTPSKTRYEYIDNGGWHFTFMGGKDQIKLKLESYGHQEYNNDTIKSGIENSLLTNKDVLGRSSFNFWIEEDNLPKYILENKQKYKKFIK